LENSAEKKSSRAKMLKLLLVVVAVVGGTFASLSMSESTARVLADLPYAVSVGNRSALAGGPFGRCDTVKLNVCHVRPCAMVENEILQTQQKFNKVLGIASTVDWDSPAAFSYAVNRVFYTGRDGYQKVVN